MYNVAIVGSGPSGLFLAKNLLKIFKDSIKINIFEKLSVPMGLLKFGVAPDHPEVKRKFLCHFEPVFSSENVKILLNVKVGNELSVSELSRSYDAVALCTGMSNSKRNWSGLADCYGADEIFGWYNSNPKNNLIDLDLSQVKRLAIIGNGNVALDVARIFAKQPHLLSNKDIDKNVMNTLENSAINEITCFGRRSLINASFTPAELREFDLLKEYCQFNVKPSLNYMAESDELTRIQLKNFQILKELINHSCKISPVKKVVNFKFSSPIIKINGDEKEVYFSTENSPEVEIFKYDILIECTGFEQRQKFIELKQDVCGKFQTDGFRIKDNIYACGWSRTGPRGNISDSMIEALNCAKTISNDLVTK